MLTPEQIAERRKGIGASDARRIVDGDWYALWAEKTGRVEAEDLSGVWAVQLGSFTEKLNLDWYERKTGHKILRGGVFKSPYPLRCTLDAFDTLINAVVEAKHVNAFSKMEDVVERYRPQVQHQMIVNGARKGILSIIIGANEPVLTEIEYDEFWANEYIERCREFWGYVERDEPPPGAPVMAAPTAPEQMRTVDMSSSNAWAEHAAKWLENAEASKTFDKAAKELKALVDEDVKLATGHGIKIIRQGNGRHGTKLLIKEI